MFEKIKQDPYIIKLYEQIELLEQDGELWHNHSSLHINNVIKTVEDVLIKLNYNQEIIEMAKIAALLHDIGCAYGKDNHAEKSYQLAKEYFENNDIKTSDNEMVLEAIKLHSGKETTNNFIAKVLIFADKIDIKGDRITNAGKKIPVVKESQHIEDIIIEINDQELIVNFVANKKINKTDLDTFYFLPKIFKAIKGFASELDLKAKILFNEETWIIKE